MEPTPTQTPIPEQTPNKKTILAVIVIVLVLALGYFLFPKYVPDENPTLPEDVNDTAPMKVVVEHTEAVNGILPAPKGFPQDIPIEKLDIIESAITDYPEMNARQLNISYRSKKTVAVKYKEYKDYMTKMGYALSESGTGSTLKAIFGTKEDVNLSVVVSGAEGGSFVQVSYLLKSVL